ncbi:MAG: aminodeoxychorismate synthase component I [Parvibaculales bacterium]
MMQSRLETVQEWVLPSGAVVQEIDWLDPCSCFAGFAQTPHALWLDSADTRHPAGAYSYIAVEPFETVTVKNGDMNGLSVEPFDHVKARLAHFNEDWSGLPDDLPDFRGGAGGYFGYDLGQGLEILPPPIAPYAVDDAGLPDMVVGLYDLVLAFDHQARRCFLFSTGFPRIHAAERSHRALMRLEDMRRRLFGVGSVPRNADESPPPPASLPASPLSASDYQNRVQKVIDYILAGDIFQANLSHRFDAELNADDTAFQFYKRLRQVSAAPFAAFFQLGDWALASASPERFLSCRNGRVETRPIKGTRPRHDDPKQDAALAATLRMDTKERAENIMIVDLLRNDIARVCKEGSINVPSLCAVESFPAVHHLVSIIEGTLRETAGPTDLLKACFPGGSISGAPKIRAMEIIAELENTCRGPYCGAIGYVGFDGIMDTNIAIRTPVIRGHKVSFQVGGGITAASDPASEYRETLDKAAGIFKALGCTHPDMTQTDTGTSEGRIS